jgi:ribosomal protein S18 acetylase RimI-like enzyme
VREVAELPTLGASDNGGTVAGFLSLKQDGPFSAEVYVMGVRPELHGRGIGKALLAAAEQRLRERGVKYLQVKTLGPSRPSRGYGRTRSFYESCCFRPLEELEGIWKDNPCLIMVKRIDVPR